MTKEEIIKAIFEIKDLLEEEDEFWFDGGFGLDDVLWSFKELIDELEKEKEND